MIDRVGVGVEGWLERKIIDKKVSCGDLVNVRMKSELGISKNKRNREGV